MAAAALALCGVVFCCDRAARADAAPRAVLVLDRGTDAEIGSASDAGNALRIWKALEARGVDAGVGAGGETLLATVPATRAGLASLDKDPVFAFRGATDPRAALAYVLDNDGEGAVDVILLGPWSQVPAEKAKSFAATIRRWNDKAPEGSRILSIGKGPGREALTTARGWAGDGRVVIGFETPTAETANYSPLAREDGPAAPLEATVRTVGDVLWMGPPPESQEGTAAPVLDTASDVATDRFEAKIVASVYAWHLVRRPQDGRMATLTFRRSAAEAVYWLAEPPSPFTFRWDKLLPDAHLVDAAGKPVPVFAALDASVGQPISLALRLQRTLSGRTPAWQVGAETGALPEGLTVKIGNEVRASPEVGETEVRITFTARAGAPLDVQGALTLTADGMPTVLRVPFAVRVQPGRLVWQGTIQTSPLPPAATDARTTFTVRAANANAPAHVALAATCDGNQARWLRAFVHTPDGGVVSWRLGEPLSVPLDVEHSIAFAVDEDALDKSAPEQPEWPGVVTLAPVPAAGLEIEGEPLAIPVRERRARLILREPILEHRLAGTTLVSDEFPILTLDADGGDGTWLVALMETAPVVRALGKAPMNWQAVPRGTGTWHVVPAGRWTGPEPGIFEDKSLTLDLALEWPPGIVPAKIQVPVRVPARWGKKGFLFIGFAGLALVLALTVLGWMRTPAVTGTLLYTVDGLAGTVGRLDLSPVKRRTSVLSSDPKGRLIVGGPGEAIAKVRATRVGGMLEYTEADGSRERRLLVDGMSLRIGRHLVRFVSGRPADTADAEPLQDVPDLLGPEYDLESGRIDTMDDD